MQLVLTWRLRLHPLAQDRPGAGPEQALSAQLDAGGAGKDKFRLKASFQNKHAGGAPTWPKLALNAIKKERKKVIRPWASVEDAES